MSLSSGLQGLSNLNAMGAEKRLGPSGPQALAGMALAFIPHPNYTASDASHLVPCAAGDRIEWWKEAVTGTWYRHPTGGNARMILRSPSSGKYYAEGDYTEGRYHAFGDWSSLSAVNITLGAAFRITSGTPWGMIISNNSKRELRQAASTQKIESIPSVSDPTAATVGIDYRFIASHGATSVLYRNNTSVSSASDATAGNLVSTSLTIMSRGAAFYTNGRFYGGAIYGSQQDPTGVAAFDAWLSSFL